MNNKLIINFTPTGMIPTKSMNHHVPTEVNEIIEDTISANELGITLVHLHARDENEVPTYKKEVYQKIVEGIEKYCPELVICLSLSGRNFNQFEKRSEAIELMPDMGSLTLSSLNFPKQASVNDPEMIVKLCEKMLDYGVKPELEVFDLGMINYGKYLIQKQLVQPPFYFNIIFGNIAGMQSDLAQMGTALYALPQESYWAFGGIGNQQLQANAIAIACGGGVRIGLEDNLYFNGKLTSNSELIKRVKEMALLHNREVMKPGEFGNLGFYNLKKRKLTS